MRASHHGPWCDEGPPDEQCLTCVGVAPDIGWWLFARLAVHDLFTRGVIAKYKQEPLRGLSLQTPDWIEIGRLQLEIAEANWRAHA